MFTEDIHIHKIKIMRLTASLIWDVSREAHVRLYQIKSSTNLNGHFIK